VNRLLGIFGGSFNPIHVGHLILAEYIREEFKLRKIIFIPTGNPPHKNVSDLEKACFRFDMVKIAVGNNPFFEVSDIEIKREGISYTSDTLKEIRGKYPDEELFFICGSDSLVQLSSWHEPESIFRLAAIIAAGRAGIPDKELEGVIAEFKNRYNARIYLSEAPHIGISSSEIRNRIKNGFSVRYMVPDAVAEYIAKNRLYR